MPYIDKLTIKRRRLAIAYTGLSMVLLLLAQSIYASPNIGSTQQQQGQYFSQLDHYPVMAVKKVYQLAQADNFISMREAVGIAKRRFPGKVLSAKKSISRNGKVVYRIKIISNSSEIRTLTIPARR